MRITLFTLEFLPFAGGIATYCHEIATGLTRLGHEVTVIAPYSSLVDVRKLRYDVNWIRGKTGRLVFFARTLQMLVRTSREMKPDLILVTHERALVLASMFQWLVTSRTVPVLHGSEVRHAHGAKKLQRFIAMSVDRYYRSRDVIVCVSSYTRSLVLESFRICPDRVVVVHNGLRDRFDPSIHSGFRVRSELRIDPDAKVLLTLARLVPRKGQDVVIRALPEVIARHPRVVYVCAGEGSYRVSLERLAESVGVSDHVLFAGLVAAHEKYSYYAACDLFVMISRREGSAVEGFGLTFLEAWHASRPVIGGNHGGVVEVIDDGVNGVMVDPEDVGAVALAISRLLDDPERLHKMGVEGRVKSAVFDQLSMARSLVKNISAAGMVRTE